VSILLEALRQKNKLAADAERAPLEEPQKSSSASKKEDEALSDMDSLVAALSIKKPSNLDWQLSHPSVETKPELVISSEAHFEQHPDVFAPLTFASESHQADAMNEAPAAFELSLMSHDNDHAYHADDQALDELFPKPDTHNLTVEETPVITMSRTDATSSTVDVMSTTPEEPPNVEQKLVPPNSSLEVSAVMPSVEDKVNTTDVIDSVALQEKVAAANKYLKMNQQTNRSRMATRLVANKLKLSPPFFGKKVFISLGLLTGSCLLGYIAWQTWQEEQTNLVTQLAAYQNSAIVVPVAGEESEVVHKQDEMRAEENALPVPIDTGNIQLPENAVKKTVTQAKVQHPTIAKRSAEKVEQLPSSQSKAIKERDGLKASGVSQTFSVSSMLLSAWNSWQQGDVVSAEKAYRSVLERQPEQRDALMGMLAITQLQAKTLPQAHDIAARLIALYPKDAEVAEAVRIFQGSTASESEQETQLKLLLKQDTQNAMAAYRLGIVYAEQKRWPEAQNAFFNAVSLDNTQPEYLANLAISYDQLGKVNLAISSYQQALQMASKKPSTVNIDMLTNRLQALQSIAAEGRM
jgi:tetratricopeptide (TPR) repeat protein